MFEKSSSPEIVAAALEEPPSAQILTALLTVSPGSLGAEEEVDFLIAWDRQASWIAAQVQPAMARVADLAEAAARACMDSTDGHDMPLRAAHAEIAAALRVSKDSACFRLETARALTGHLAVVHAELAAGRISYAHATAICETTYLLDDKTAAAVAARVLQRAGHQSVAAMRRCLRRAVIAADPTAAAARAAKAKADRQLEWRPLDDGMAELRVTGPAADIHRLFNTVDALAKTLPKIGSDGTFLPIGARRVDALIDLVTNDRTDSPGGQRRKPAVTANITIDLLTLLGLQHNPVELDGYGPLSADVGRALAADAKTWRRLVCDPFTGALLDLGLHTYEPSVPLGRFVGTRDPRCTFPGCHQPAWRCDIDHIIPFKPGCCGPTDRSNLGPLCKSHHRLKHEAGWHKKRDQDTGQTTWTSPLGKHYFVEPTDFRGDPDSDPFDWPDDLQLADGPQEKTEDLSPKPETADTAEVCPF